jgi:molecular chaperone IbpA
MTLRDPRFEATLLDAEEDAAMQTMDFTPLYRSVVGFDRLADLLSSAATEAESNYPPYNIERTDENAFRIEIGVAGFRTEDLEIELKENLLTVRGRKVANDQARRYIHRGLAERNFERRFQLADYVIVTGAELADGLLSIELKRELPETLRARQIQITTGGGARKIETKKSD